MFILHCVFMNNYETEVKWRIIIIRYNNMFPPPRLIQQIRF